MHTMRIGQIFRYARPYSAEQVEIDGYPNFFYATRLTDHPLALWFAPLRWSTVFVSPAVST